MQDDLDKCILELKKPESERNLQIIVKYIQTLQGFMNILKDANEDYNFYLNECAKILKYSQRKKNDIIVEQGDKGDSFFLLLKGSVSFLVSRPTTYEMTKDEYLYHLFKLRRNNSHELLRQCIQLNHTIFPVDESFDLYIKNIANKVSHEFLENKFITDKAIELYEYIKSNESKIKTTNISVEKYIERNKVEDFKKENYFTFDNHKKKEKKSVKIPNYIIISKCEKGETFGELALEQNAGKRQASVITNEPTDFAIIYRNEYNNLLKNAVEKAKKKFFSVIDYYNIFNEVSPYALDKKYYKLFNLRKYDKGINLIEQNKEIEYIYFIVNGEFEISTNRNIKEVNDLIIYYKNYIRKYSNKLDYKLYNPIEEERENDDLTLNKRYKSKEQNEILFEKRYIKLTILQDKDILGIRNLMSPINKKKSKGLINCKTLNTDCEVYELEISQFYFISEFEDGVENMTIEYEINKIKMLIQRLQMHKKRIYNLITKKEKEYSDFANKLRLHNIHLKQKNRLHTLEANQIFEGNEMKNFIEQKEKEKEIKRKILENDKKKSNKNSKFHLYKSNQVVLPSIKGNKNLSFGNIFSPKKNMRNIQYNKYREGLFNRNLYEHVFNSYVITDINENDKSNQIKINQSASNNNDNAVYDALIFDRFNSCYTKALINLKYQK